MPVCGAKNRAGQPCKRKATPGKTRCNLHGGKSTGAKTPKGKAKVGTQNMTHGAHQTREAFEAYGHPESYLAGLSSSSPDLMSLVTAETDLSAEVRFARMKLLRSELIVAKDPATALEAVPAQVGLMEQIRKLAGTQNELRPGGDATGAFTVTLKVVGGQPPVASVTPVPESGDPACS